MTSQLKGLHMENLMQCAVVHPYINLAPHKIEQYALLSGHDTP